MSDTLTREFGAQLITTMNSVVKRAMLEIMNIFENTLHGHQMALAQKGEEIAQLKVKLQRVEVKLTEREGGHDDGEEGEKTQTNGSQRELDNVNASGQTYDVPEIDFEVPDDWCAPMGCETVTKKEDDMCPSVRLRQLYIPLRHIPVIKVANCDIDSPKQRKGGSRSKRNSSVKESDKSVRETSTQTTHRQPVRHDMKKLVQGIKQECTDETGRPKGLRRERNSTGKEQVKAQKNTKVTAMECIEQKAVEHVSGKMHSCKVCMKVFDTKFGLSVHVRSHTRCKGCKKVFRFPSFLKSHQPFCAKLKKLLAKKAQSTDPGKPPPSSSLSESSIQKNGPTKKHYCSLCNKEFDFRYRLKEHMCLHTGDRPYPCSICPMKYRLKQSLRKHIMKRHKGQVDSSVINSLSWTMPLEVIEGQEDVTSPGTDTSREINRKKLQREHKPDRGQPKPNRDRGTAKSHSRGQLSRRKEQCSNFIIQCAKCEKRFSSQALLDRHVYRYHGEWPRSCKVCGKGFVLPGRLRNHMQSHM